MITTIGIVILILALFCLSYLFYYKIKRYKFELEETRNNFALAMKAGSISAWKYDFGTKFFTPMMGKVVAGEGFSWNDMLQVLHVDDHEPLTALFAVLSSGQQKSGEIVLRYFSPEHDDYRYYESKMRISRNADQSFTYIIGTQRDITEKCIRQLEMDNARKSIDLAMSAAEITAWDYDIRSSRYRTLYGNSVAEKRAALKDIFDDMHPDDVEPYTQFVSALLSDTDAGTDSIVFRVRKEAPAYRFMRCVISVVRNSKGGATHLIGSLLDITQRKLSEQHLEQAVRRNELIINNINSGLAYIGTDYIVQWENMAACSASLSYEAYKEGQLCYQSAHCRCAPCENCVLQRAMQSRQVEQIEFTFDNGRSIEVFATPVFTSEGEIEGVVIRVDNITERKMMFQALELAKVKAEESDRLKSAFLANMSHEIRTPLNAIVGFSDLLLVTDNEEEKQQYGDIIATNNELLLQLINDILDLSKMESGMINLVPQPFDLAHLFDAVGTTMRQRVKPGVELICNSPYASCMLTLDPNRLTQVVTNFVTNAIKFTTQGSITMGYEYVNGGIRVYVSDTGIGIPEEKQLKVFDRFEKLNDFAQGTGLGLSICKAIMDAQNGKIGVESVVGQGTTFWAWAPFDAVIVEKDATEAPLVEAIAHTATHVPLPPVFQAETEKKSILVAEDIDSNFLLVSSILQKQYHLARVDNGAEAVEAMKQHSYDVVLMDMKMPVMNGMEATEAIRKFDTTTPIIALTAHAFDSDRKAALAAGCNEYVVKPINRKQLFDALKKYI